MSEENATNTIESPGHILRAKRVQSDFTIEQITAETKIAASVIRAIEDDNFTELPAPVFTKGFYTLYAKKLGLDAEYLVTLYQTLYDEQTIENTKETIQNDVTALTKRPFVPIFSLIGFTLLLLLLIFGTLSWYFSWNPADFLSQQLRGIETEYHQSDPKEIGERSETSTASSSTNSHDDVVKTSTVVKATIMQFPAKGDSQGIEIGELGNKTPLVTLTSPTIVPKNVLEAPTPQTVLQ